MSTQADNTVRENKNQIMIKYLSWLVATKGLKLASLQSSRVGHTHNRLDAVFGMLSRAFRFEDTLTDLEDVQQKLDCS